MSDASRGHAHDHCHPPELQEGWKEQGAERIMPRRGRKGAYGQRTALADAENKKCLAGGLNLPCARCSATRQRRRWTQCWDGRTSPQIYQIQEGQTLQAVRSTINGGTEEGT